MPSWTTDQSRAINERGGKIIVSAAAGSGKTAVLSQRVITYILSGGSISKLLVVTFTKAAAEEMKSRIKDKINEAYLKDTKNTHLKNELSLVDISDITTMDAFYGNIVKDNFEKLGIDKNFDILSNEEENILKNKVLKEVFRNSFKKYDNFKDTLNFFGANDLNLIKDIVLKVSGFLDTIPFKDKVVDKIINKYDGNYYKDLFFSEIKNDVKSYQALYDDIINDLYNESDQLDKTIEIAKADLNYINDLLKIDSFDELSSRLRSISFLRFQVPKDYKDSPCVIKYKTIRAGFKNIIKKLSNDLSLMTDEIYNSDMILCKKHVMVLFNVVNDYMNLLLEEKKKINAYSFSDISHFVIHLLIKEDGKTNLANKYSLKYDEILIDEYQDTNNLQNIIFNAISKDDTNLFIVGDVKQSIYRFRSAAPEIFNNDKKNAFYDTFPKLITLSKNFRSRSGVLDFCNFIFENTMTDSFGEVSYDRNERLYLGANFEDGSNLDTEVIIIDGKEKDDDNENNITNTQKEAIIVADKVKSLIDSKYQVYDNKNGIWKNITPSDIALLFRSTKNSSYYIEALKRRGISAYAEDSRSYFDNYEVKLVINMLKIIDNPYDDIALLSVLQSACVNLSLDDIVELRYKDKYNSLYDNLLKSDNNVVKSFLENLKSLKEYSYNHSLYEILNMVYKTYDIIPVTLSATQGINKEKNLIQMINHATNFESNKTKSLHEFITYLEDINLNKDSLEGINPLSDKNNVLITTIHKSKGLEYPVVFVCETGKLFNTTDLKNDVMINEDYGMVFNLRDFDNKIKYESIPIKAFKSLEKNKMLSEELRILYVALTRAKEKIIITGFSSNLEKLVDKASVNMGEESVISNTYLKNVSCFLDIIVACLLRHPNASNLRYYSKVDNKVFSSASKVNIKVIDGININESEFNTEIKLKKEDFDIEWFNKILSLNNKYDTYPQYLSVSDIKKDKSYKKAPNFMSDGISHTKLGTLYHKIFEYLDVKKYSVGTLKEALEELVLKRLISKEEYESINLEKIFAYLTSDLYDILLKSDAIYKEKEITFEIPTSYYDKELKSGNILTSGIIDLLFIKDDTYYIVDYKTDKVDKLDELVDRYKVQLDLYEIGVKNIFNAKDVKKYIYSVYLNKFIEI